MLPFSWSFGVAGKMRRGGHEGTLVVLVRREAAGVRWRWEVGAAGEGAGAVGRHPGRDWAAA